MPWIAKHTGDPRSSLWSTTAAVGPDTPPLTGRRSADAVVVGGGFTGLSAALHLAEAGADVVLLEAKVPGWGASGRSNGQVIPAYGPHTPEQVAQTFGRERGEHLNGWVAGSADLVFELIRRQGIDCEAVQTGWIQPARDERAMATLWTKYEQWAERGGEVEWLCRERTAELTGSPVYSGAWMHLRGGHLQPLSFARGLAAAALHAGAAVHGHSPATRIARTDRRWRVTTPSGVVTADHIVLATNGYTDGLWPQLRRQIISRRSFQVATSPLDSEARSTVLPRGHCLSDPQGGLGACRADRDGRLVTSGFPSVPLRKRAQLQRSTARLKQVFPQLGELQVDYVWEGRVAITANRLPRYHEPAPGIHVGFGYSGRGIALAIAMGKMIADRTRGELTERKLPVAKSGIQPAAARKLLPQLSRFVSLALRWRRRGT